MSNKYSVYPVYGKDKPSCLIGVPQRIILGIAKDVDNIKLFRQAARFGGVKWDNFIVIDWKHYKVKKYFNGYEYNWQTFKSGDFWKLFRFTTPCEDWEIESKGHVVDAVSV